jgi:hypothetical protein
MKVEICRNCKGFAEFVVAGDFLNEDSQIQSCTQCNGTGRILIETFIVELPYDFDKSKLIRARKDVQEILISLKKNTKNEE